LAGVCVEAWKLPDIYIISRRAVVQCDVHMSNKGISTNKV